MFAISGRVIKGEGYGRKIGFPTVNLDRRDFLKLKKKPKFGIYAGKVILPTGRAFRAGLVIGPRDKKGLPKLEAHLLNFRGRTPARAKFIFKKFLRPFRKFSAEKALKTQIQKDLKKC
ncbi:hypothetical protein A3I25_01710 [Candidatus Nomurabacteria bacterium RIFCSPLOWO2_02_FULL_42_17]|uniref:riboflavin kinase n=2 Tax=Candidatus Nomuraibacteriota TaxID=1752729 RepID=A0A1F6WIN1_9BACT|nr:MAG: hypothetical protein UV08_C0027G0005 [Parcubacteria group bacterium GW2011_GWA2_42_18]OGI81565.1 MAG: hypothetical protein A3B93_01365 [Candidatus Nomurabacteria bacterium RIFCSPHIGHO2_02_FULL_42_24]OGI96425.1 MAG: hypothetical protein A3I25_01710 [Candidatus Nomurabacteria bacterium RIFCSPLOWO2_02_FULL_42_17]